MGIMKKTFVRWYEKDEYLRTFMEMLADMDPDAQCEIAIDLIMRASDFIDRDYTNIIQDVGNYNPRDFKRWYDKNPNIHLAIESLRDLKEDQRDLIVKEFIDKIFDSQYVNIEGIGN